ncbi:Fur family transcriptional regulator [Anaeromyxobacter paludicola]|uniref:Ferric uptake regulation protein n=1 Tax=Anaeromyxobacter paludicola TaxID=2918171 RepID=A0ABN6N470_9BACT|nr:transcriptional repressor [Anaeromyxobacter paludicola]
MSRQAQSQHESSEAGADQRSPVALLGTFIAARGLKHSRQRDVIVETFFEIGGHVPVEALVARVHERDRRISVATVYRTMKLLAECGLALPRQFGDGQTRYEPATAGAHHHDHLICTGCGAIVEFENEDIEDLQLRVARSHGFEVESHKLELYGRCAACRARGEGRS